MNGKMPRWAVLSLWVAALVSICAAAAFAVIASGDQTQFTEIIPPAQAEPITPDWAKPAEPPVIDFGENLALNKRPKTNGFADVYKPANATDGDTATYWEGEKFPSELTIDLEGAHRIRHIVIRLRPAMIWSKRTQTFSLYGSMDGETWETIIPSAAYKFDPKAANIIVAETPPENSAEARYVKISFEANTGAKGGQAAEVEIYSE